MRIGIVGFGTVGKHLSRLFDRAGYSVQIYDKYLPEYGSKDAQVSIQHSDLVFVAVPTPEGPEGTIDLREIEDVVRWINPPICIKSTITPGTTDRLIAETGKSIIFSPEYVGETPYHKYASSLETDLVVLGGDAETAERFARIYRQAYGPIPRYFKTSAITAELAKYMENSFFATKLAFVAQFHLLAHYFGANFDELREIWIADTRVGRSHSIIIDKPGFGGKCLPKDLAAIIHSALPFGGAPLLEAVQLFNNELRSPKIKENAAQKSKLK